MYLLKSHEEEVLKSEIKIVQVWSGGYNSLLARVSMVVVCCDYHVIQHGLNLSF